MRALRLLIDDHHAQLLRQRKRDGLRFAVQFLHIVRAPLAQARDDALNEAFGR